MGVSYLDPTQPIGVSCCFCNKLPYHRGPNCTSFVCFCCGVRVLAGVSLGCVPLHFLGAPLQVLPALVPHGAFPLGCRPSNSRLTSALGSASVSPCEGPRDGRTPPQPPRLGPSVRCPTSSLVSVGFRGRLGGAVLSATHPLSCNPPPGFTA